MRLKVALRYCLGENAHNMNGTDDTFELNESLQKTVQETKITAEYIRKKIEEKLVTGETTSD